MKGLNMAMSPSWLKKRLNNSDAVSMVKTVLAKTAVNTVCEAALCPNLNECFSRMHATFLILGEACTRRCGFCSVKKSATLEVDPGEPARVREAAEKLKLKYVVVTSVTRDDLPDGGAGQFAEVIAALKDIRPAINVEVLVPDFKGAERDIRKVIEAGPDVFGHNIETVRRLYAEVRPDASYERSLGVLRFAKSLSPGLVTKSGMMVGLDERPGEVLDTMKDLRKTGCDIVTIGQYLRPSPANLPVARFAKPEEFTAYKNAGEKLGFKHVAAGPFIRSSYFAEEAYRMTREVSNEGCKTSAAG